MFSRSFNLNSNQAKPESYRSNRKVVNSEHFVCYMGEGWYVETPQDEYGPFQSLRDAENYYEVVGNPMRQTLIGTELQKEKRGIGARLWEARTARRLTQVELGKLAGFSQAVVQNIENGVLWHPSVVSELAVAMGLTPAWLQWGEPFTDKQDNS